MSKIFITTLDDAAPAPLPLGGELFAQGNVETCRVLSEERPIHLWKHKLAPGAILRWTSVSVGHVVYLWEGAMTVDGKPIVGEGSAAIEHGANCEIVAGDDGCVLLDFYRTQEESTRPGGHVHALSKGEAPSGVVSRLNMTARAYADSDCPNCELWLHESDFMYGSPDPRRHYHTKDEVMVCLRGHMTLGDRQMGRGAVLAIDKEALYSFFIPETGGAFINFRGARSDYVLFDKQGKHPPQDEIGLLRAAVKVAPHLVAAGAANA